MSANRPYSTRPCHHTLQDVTDGVVQEFICILDDGHLVDHQDADERIPSLLASGAASRYFLSCEPLLGPVDLSRWSCTCDRSHPNGHHLTCQMAWDPPLDWVIVGGESGPGARPMHPDWVRSLRDQCAATGTAFHFKQWGAWAPTATCADPIDLVMYAEPDAEDTAVRLTRIGKKAAGREGETNANMLAAAINVVHRITNGTMKRAGSAYPTPQQALKLLHSEPAIREGATWGNRLNSRLRFPGGLGCGLYHLFSSVDAEDAEVFFESLITGENLTEGSPILALRNNLERRAIKKYDRERMEIVAAWTIKAWNAWREGSEIQRLYWTPGGSRPEPFPEIR